VAASAEEASAATDLLRITVKKKVAFLAAMVILTVAGIAPAYSHARSVNAQDVPNILESVGMNDVGTAVQDADKQDGVDTTANQLASQSAAVLAQSPSVLETLRVLNDKAKQRFLKPGWLYIKIISEGNTDLGNRGVLPNGQILSEDHTSEIWYHLDDQNRVIEFVSIDRAADGQIIQSGVFRNGVQWNSATNETLEVKPFALETLDFGVLRDAQVHDQTTPQVQSDDMLDGRLVVRFDSIERYAKPLQFAVFNQGVVANEGRAYFDPTTGQLLRRELIAHLADGSERIVSRSTFEFKSGVTPPAEVFEILVNVGAEE
jgi:hypothetical protein